MSQDNQITLRGFLTAEPRLFQKSPEATPMTEIRVGCTPRRLNRETGEWQDAPTSYYTIKCWRRLAVNVLSSLHKGDMVVVRGRFYMSHWVDNQQRPRATLEIEADSLGHDLAYGWSHFLRGTRPQPERAAGVNAGEAARQDVGPERVGEGDEVHLAEGEPAEWSDDPGSSASPPTSATESENGGMAEGEGDSAASALTVDETLSAMSSSSL